MPNPFRLLPPWRHKSRGFDAPIAPKSTFAVIGDVHGCDALLMRVLEQLRSEVPGIPIVFVGDYVDRGPESAGVLSRVRRLTLGYPENMIALKGNHEAMMLDFIDFPARSGHRWLMNGGDRTLESCGIPVPADMQNESDLIAARDALMAQMDPAIITWLRALPLMWQSGNVVVTHAGGDPGKPIEPRRGHGLLWGHPDFLRKPRQDGLWMVHGHFIVDEAGVTAGRIAVDTGAYRTGHLSAAIIEAGEVRFIGT
ncbi:MULTISPECIES: metallophosphoesterase family protein [unclassified Roseovarius]|uniref:metallophosphoesterase family protein n=1 Tax=unclassified Roseovarius TaxID=2614913 RepID=UPI00273D178E|nr:MULTISPECIES: metallophosphoesterase family protein [unclassified Roseovarius]